MLLARVSRVFVAVITPSFGERFWPMYELDLALSSNTDGNKVFVPVLVHVDHIEVESLVSGRWYKAWLQMIEDREHGGLVDIDRWKQNWKELMEYQSIDGRAFGLLQGVTIKGGEQKLAQSVAGEVITYISGLR
jgi:hypothetical protein